MFPFQYNNPFLQLNLDLNSSQPSGFPSQYLPKPELPTRIPSVYVQDTQPVYNNIPSLLNKRPASMDLASASTKFINQEGFPFPVEVARAQDMAKNLQMHGKQDDLAPQKMIYRGAPDMYGVPKGSALGAQQIPRLNNGLQYPGLEMPQVDAQSYLGESASQAYIRQYLESKSMNGQDLGALMGSQNNDMQKYLASFYGLPNGAQNNLTLQNLASLGNLGGLGNLGNLANMGGYGNLGSMNNPLMMELLNQARNQQLIQQLQEQAKNEQMRNLSLEMMLLNSGMGQNGLMNLQQANMGQAGISQSLSPPSLSQNKSTAQTLILQRPDPVRQQDGLTRKDSTHSNNKVPIAQQQQPPAKEVKEDPKPKNVVLANTESKGRQERLPVREEKPMYREERPQPQQQVKMNESRVKKVEQNNMVLQAPIVQEPEPNRDFNGDRGDRRKGRVNLQVEQQQTVVKKPVVQSNQRSQRRMQEFEEPMEEVLPVSRGRKSELAVQEKMAEEKKLTGRSSQNRMLAKEMNYIEAQKTQCTESEYSDKGTFGPASEEMRGHSLMRQFSLENANNGNLVENLYKTPEERLEEDKAVQKIVLTKVGRQYQTTIPEMVLNDDEEEEEVQQRECKLVWDPQVVNPRDIGNYMKNLQRLLGAKTINQEKALKLLCKKDFDMDETLSVVKKNERYYSNFFGNSSCTRELRSRRNVE